MPIIAVIDEQSVYRSGLRQLIEHRIEQARVIEASAIDDVRESERIDLVLIDSASAVANSLDVFTAIHERNRQTRFAMLSTSTARSDVFGCLSAGFHGFVYKLQSDDELLSAVNDLLSGRIYVPGWLADRVGDRAKVTHLVELRVETLKLTRRQREILPLLACGLSNKEVARSLCIAEGTVKIHTAALVRALGARNRTEAAYIAAKLVSAGTGFEPR